MVAGRFESRLRSLDFLSPHLRLNFEGHGGVRTIWGALLTFIYILVLIGSATLTWRSYLRTDNPVSMSETLQTEESPLIDLKKSNLLPIIYGIAGYSDIVQVEELPTYMTVLGFLQKWKTFIDPVTGLAKTLPELVLIPFVPCKTLSPEKLAMYDYMKSSPVVHSMVMPHGLCMDAKDDASVFGKIGDSSFQLVSVYIKPCSLTPSTLCKDRAGISGLRLHVVTPDTSFEQTNFEKPFSQSPNGDMLYYLNPSAVQTNFVRLKKTISNDYIGVLPKWTYRESFFDIKDILYNINERDNTILSCSMATIMYKTLCPSYLEYHFKSTGTLMRIGRRYKTILETFGEIGGVNGILYALLLFLDLKLNAKKRNDHLLKSVYGDLLPSLYSVEAAAVSSAQAKLAPDTKVVPVKDGFSLKNILCPCLRKKSQMEVITESVNKRAIQNIEYQMNVVNIIKQLNDVQVLCKAFMQERHKVISPALAIELQRVTERTESDLSAALQEVSKQKLLDNQMKDEQVKVSQGDWNVDGQRGHGNSCFMNLDNAICDGLPPHYLQWIKDSAKRPLSQESLLSKAKTPELSHVSQAKRVSAIGEPSSAQFLSKSSPQQPNKIYKSTKLNPNQVNNQRILVMHSPGKPPNQPEI